MIIARNSCSKVTVYPVTGTGYTFRYKKGFLNKICEIFLILIETYNLMLRQGLYFVLINDLKPNLDHYSQRADTILTKLEPSRYYYIYTPDIILYLYIHLTICYIIYKGPYIYIYIIKVILFKPILFLKLLFGSKY